MLRAKLLRLRLHVESFSQIGPVVRNLIYALTNAQCRLQTGEWWSIVDLFVIKKKHSKFFIVIKIGELTTRLMVSDSVANNGRSVVKIYMTTL